MKLNLRLIRAFQFVQQFKLYVWHKLDKKYIISNALSRLANINIGYINSFYSKLDTLFIYNTSLVKIYSSLISTMLADYKADKS